MRSLEGKVALVAGGSRGAGRGIAVELGAAGATVYVTGRTTSTQTSEYRRPETIEETAALVTEARRRGRCGPRRSPGPRRGRSAGRPHPGGTRQARHPGQRHLGRRAPVRVEQAGLGAQSGERAATAAARRRHASHHRPLRASAADREARRAAGRGDRRHGGVQCGPLPPVGVLRSGQNGAHSHGLGARQGPCTPWSHGGLHHAGVAALRDDARQLSRHRSELARRLGDIAALRDLGNAAFRRARRRRARCRSRAGSLERGSRFRAAAWRRFMASPTSTDRSRIAGATSSRSRTRENPRT